MSDRRLSRDEIPLIWTIDRRETITTIYRMEAGGLVLTPAPFEVPGWRPGQSEVETPMLEECFDQGGTFLGRFDGDALVGIAVVDGKRIGPRRNHVQLKMLYVSRDHRERGVGSALFESAGKVAREYGASHLYVSATPTRNTVDFYRRQGCVPTPEPDPKLLALEPEDIHLTCVIRA